MAWYACPQVVAVRILCEDDDDEIERKIYDTAMLYGHRRADYSDFAYAGRFAEENLLFARSKRGIATTNLYADLCQMVADEKRDLLMFDGIPDIYALNLNDQGEVTWALGKMLAMAKPTQGERLAARPSEQGRHVRIHRLRRMGEQAPRPAVSRSSTAKGRRGRCAQRSAPPPVAVQGEPVGQGFAGRHLGPRRPSAWSTRTLRPMATSWTGRCARGRPSRPFSTRWTC